MAEEERRDRQPRESLFRPFPIPLSQDRGSQSHTTGDQIPTEGSFTDRAVKAMDRWMKSRQEKFSHSTGFSGRSPNLR